MTKDTTYWLPHALLLLILSTCQAMILEVSAAQPSMYNVAAHDAWVKNRNLSTKDCTGGVSGDKLKEDRTDPQKY
jgi:hypothetical protein